MGSFSTPIFRCGKGPISRRGLVGAARSRFGEFGTERGGGEELAFTVSGERQTRLDVLAGQLGEVGENLVLGHAGSQILQHVVNGNPHPADARLAAALARLNSDKVCVVHGGIVCGQIEFSKDSSGPVGVA